MKKILSFFAAMLFAFAVNAQEIPSTDFIGGYFFGAKAAVLDGNIELNEETETPYLRYFDRQVNGTATWQIQATKACKVAVTLNMFDNSWNNAVNAAYKNGGHIFTVKVLNGETEVGSVAESAESSTIGNIALAGEIKLPAAGTYTVQLLNSREWSKCGIKGITLAAEAVPETDFAAPGYEFKAENAKISGNIWYNSENKTLYYNDKSFCGTAAWPIHATRGCYVSVTLNNNEATPNGHKYKVSVLDDNDKVIAAIQEPSQTSAKVPVTLDGTILIPEAGDYTIKLDNLTGWSSAVIDGIVLTYAADAPVIPDINWELNGGAMPLKGSTNAELWEAFKPDYNAFYASKLSVPRSDQPIDKAASFIVDDPGSRAMMLSETAGWKWLAEYAAVACTAQGWDLLSDETESHWRWVLDSFFNKRDKTSWPMGSTHAVFTEAGKEENWLPVYRASMMPESVDAEFTLVAPVKDGFVFGGWFDNAELTGDALTTIPANFKGTLYAKWNEPEPQRFYLKPGIWYWEGNDEKFAIYAWADGKEAIWSDYMTLAEKETAIWTGTIPAGYDNVIFVRFGKGDGNPDNWYETTAPAWDNGHMWNQTNDLQVDGENDLYTITMTTWEGHEGKCPGEWSKYVYVEPAKFYIIGIGSWELEDAIRSDEESYVLHLEAGYYEMKISVDGTWATSKGFKDLTEVADGLSENEEYGNICFTLDEAGDVTVTYTAEVFKLEGNFHVAAVIEPADRRIIAWDLKSVLNGNDYKFTYKSNIDGYEANLIFLENDVEVGTKALDAPKAGVNEVIVSKDELPAGILNWAIELKAGKVENFAEFTDASRGIYNFYLPQGIAVNNCTESDYFGHMYITEVDGASDGASDRTDNQKGGIFEYDLDLNELNPTNQGWLPGGIVAGTDRQEMKRITVDKVDGMIYFNRTKKIMKIDPADMTKATDILEGKEGITKVNSCFALNGVVYFMDNANTTNGGTLKKIDAEGTISTIIQSTTWANADNAICGDGRGGLWIAQHRAQIDVYSILTHINAAGEIDFKVVPTSDEEVKALFPSTNGQPSYRGQLDYNTNEDILAFGGNRVVSLFKVTYDAETGVPSLVRLMQTNVFGTKAATNIDGVAFDFAGNVYFLNATTERMYAYGVPTDANEVVVPAKSSLKVSSTATAIDETIAPVKAQKIFRGGQILIIRDGKIYNMMGQIVR